MPRALDRDGERTLALRGEAASCGAVRSCRAPTGSGASGRHPCSRSHQRHRQRRCPHDGGDDHRHCRHRHRRSDHRRHRHRTTAATTTTAIATAATAPGGHRSAGGGYHPAHCRSMPTQRALLINHRLFLLTCNYQCLEGHIIEIFRSEGLLVTGGLPLLLRALRALLLRARRHRPSRHRALAASRHGDRAGSGRWRQYRKTCVLRLDYPCISGTECDPRRRPYCPYAGSATPSPPTAPTRRSGATPSHPAQLPFGSRRLRDVARLKLATGWPLGVYRNSGSRPRLPTRITLLTLYRAIAVLLPALTCGRVRSLPHPRRSGGFRRRRFGQILTLRPRRQLGVGVHARTARRSDCCRPPSSRLPPRPPLSSADFFGFFGFGRRIGRDEAANHLVVQTQIALQFTDAFGSRVK